MRRALDSAGRTRHRAIDLRPNDGRESLVELANQVEEAAESLLDSCGADKLDLVGFSMGALLGRAYIQRLSGRARVRRFVSIAGPHRGTQMARYWLPLSGVREMRPESPFLHALESDPDPFGDVEVHTIWTRHDRMIVPPSSSQLEGAASDTEIPSWSHRLLLMDGRTVRKVVSLLTRQSTESVARSA